MKNLSMTSSPIFIFIFALTITLIIPVMIFIFGNPYYDRAGNWLFLVNQRKAVRQSNIHFIQQPIISNSKNFGRLTIVADVIRSTVLRLELYNKEGVIIRYTTLYSGKPRPLATIRWEFPPIENSLKEAYSLSIAVPRESKDALSFVFFPGENKALINNTEETMTLAYFTESKFLSFFEKIQTLKIRIKTYKPPFIQMLFFPLFGFYLIIFPVTLWHSLKIILQEKNHN